MHTQAACCINPSQAPPDEGGGAAVPRRKRPQAACKPSSEPGLARFLSPSL
eukprot:NODE_23388_length_237_cov_4.063830_g22218_i0.p2 GENE.NODE_23388_length_237_cov_4.063830_g22218_i0~~NODE_23388_length_237_cov_4.063830_g22218_i0.p2  ORF type:complete len:51 (+),score=0.18 NODE_23388_length_237_cov_4.063830_g22218_i0:82-234(+)